MACSGGSAGTSRRLERPARWARKRGSSGGRNSIGIVFRDRQGNEIDVMTWSDRFQDLDYRIIRDDVVVPTCLQVRTVWEGIDDLAGCMFATGVNRLFLEGRWSGFVTFAETPTESDARHVHERIVTAIRESAMPSAWSEALWRLSKSDLWAASS